MVEKWYGLRAKARNFSREDMEAGIKFAHENGVKVYVTANIVAHNEDLEGIREYFRELKEIGPDALIISDPGVFMIAKEECPDIERHISTQANSTNYATYNFWYAQGASRVVAARELSLKELSEIRANIPENMEIEAFVHGAMCISHSGRCLLSNYFTGRNANMGACTHPCRWKYYVMEESRPGEYLPVEENERGTYIFNSKDLCMIEHIPDLLEAGVDSLKIEGRMKTALYVAAVTERIEEQSTIIRLLQNYLKRIWIITVKKSQNARIVSLLQDFIMEKQTRIPRSMMQILILRSIHISESCRMLMRMAGARFTREINSQ